MTNKKSITKIGFIVGLSTAAFWLVIALSTLWGLIGGNINMPSIYALIFASVFSFYAGIKSNNTISFLDRYYDSFKMGGIAFLVFYLVAGFVWMFYMLRNVGI